MKSKDGFDIVTCIQIHKIVIHDDVLERLEGRESFIDTDDTLGEKLISTASLNDILTDEDDDTNTQTRDRIEELYEKIKDYDYLMIINC